MAGRGTILEHRESQGDLLRLHDVDAFITARTRCARLV